jgi:hypothetical protein
MLWSLAARFRNWLADTRDLAVPLHNVSSKQVTLCHALPRKRLRFALREGVAG